MNKGKEGKGEENRAHLADFPVVEMTGMLRAAWGWSRLGRASLTLTPAQPTSCVWGVCADGRLTAWAEN